MHINSYTLLLPIFIWNVSAPDWAEPPTRRLDTISETPASAYINIEKNFLTNFEAARTKDFKNKMLQLTVYHITSQFRL
jgi:hypothetical protein